MTGSAVRSSDSVAVVTGGGQGLGRAFAHALAGTGRAVAIVDRNGENAAKVAQEIEAEGGRARGYAVDVAAEAEVTATRDRIADDLGPVEVLVNSAAIFSTLEMGPFTDISPTTWRKVIDVNVTGTFLCCQAFVPVMIGNGYGKVVNISSATVFTGRPGYLHYVTSKAAILGLTRSLASEVGQFGVRVNAITPGSTETEVERATINRAARERMAADTALRRVQVPEDLVGTVVFLAGEASDFITGQTINVDGGFAFH
jgi:3-oxoacyl-[acyl-carrier protein] reductase